MAQITKLRVFLVDQMVKNLPPKQIWAQSLGWEDPLEKGRTMHSIILAWRIPWIEEPGRLPWGHVGSMGSQRVRCDWVTNTHTQTYTSDWCAHIEIFRVNTYVRKNKWDWIHRIKFLHENYIESLNTSNNSLDRQLIFFKYFIYMVQHRTLKGKFKQSCIL